MAKKLCIWEQFLILQEFLYNAIACIHKALFFTAWLLVPKENNNNKKSKWLKTVPTILQTSVEKNWKQSCSYEPLFRKSTEMVLGADLIWSKSENAPKQKGDCSSCPSFSFYYFHSIWNMSYWKKNPKNIFTVDDLLSLYIEHCFRSTDTSSCICTNAESLNKSSWCSRFKYSATLLFAPSC